MNVAEWLARAGRVHPDRPALFHGTDLCATYRDLAARVAALAGMLTGKLGLAAGDRVAVFMTNRPAYLEALYAAWWAGLVVVPINAKLHPREAAWIIRDAGARAVVVSEDCADGLADLFAGEPEPRILSVDDPSALAAADVAAAAEPVGRMPGDLAWLFYTSGTTGRPKGVMMTHANLAAMTHAYFVDVDPVAPQDAIVYAAPMSHGAGLYNFMHVLKGARHVVPASGGFDANEFLDLAQATGNVSTFAAPTMVRRLVDAARQSGRDGAGIKTIVYGGGPMYLADIIEAVEVMGPRFVQIYGQGESPMTITALARDLVADRIHPRWRDRLASVGVAQSPVRVRIADPDGRDVPPETLGEILVQGSPVMAGYWNRPEATAQAIRGGWLWTGDVGSMDADGFVTLRDRSKDVIISGGTNIYPREVEEVLLTHPAVHEAAVVGRPHPEWGEEVVAFVTAAPGQLVDPAVLDRLCLDSIARFKRPKTYRVVDSLPKNNYGKILKTELRAWLAADPRTREDTS